MKTRALIGALALATLPVVAAESGQTTGPDAAKGESSQPPGQPRATLTATHYQIDLAALSRAQENPPYEVRGLQTTEGRVVDREGTVLLKSTEEEEIYAAVVSPDKKKVLVHLATESGNRSVVLEPAGGQVTKLPEMPPVDHALSFSWHWAGADLLFGESAIEAVDAAGKPLPGGEEPVLSQRKFYTFDLKTKQFAEVTMPGSVTERLVVAVDVMGDGHVHLMIESPRESVEPDLGWFKVQAPR